MNRIFVWILLFSLLVVSVSASSCGSFFCSDVSTVPGDSAASALYSSDVAVEFVAGDSAASFFSSCIGWFCSGISSPSASSGGGLISGSIVENVRFCGGSRFNLVWNGSACVSPWGNVSIGASIISSQDRFIVFRKVNPVLNVSFSYLVNGSLTNGSNVSARIIFGNGVVNLPIFNVSTGYYVSFYSFKFDSPGDVSLVLAVDGISVTVPVRVDDSSKSWASARDWSGSVWDDLRYNPDLLPLMIVIIVVLLGVLTLWIVLRLKNKRRR